MKMLARRSHRSVSLGVLALLVWLAPAVASAQVAAGVRAGVSIDPDQFYVGGHIETDPLVERLVFKPNVEVGFRRRRDARRIQLRVRVEVRPAPQ